MTNEERRFAIIIGINDYDVKPLNFCVNDATAVADKLEEKCLFKKEDIFLITSEQGKTTKDITGHFENSLKQIETNLVPTKDSVFFFFAGHGKYQFENSGLQFHDSFTEISNIFEKINELQPKHQCYVIDACESGGKVLTRNSEEEDFINKYISKSSGTLFMYASTENENAREISDIKHGLFTYYFLKAIDNDNIYDEGILTPNRIQEYIAKETLKESDFKQTPVIESRTVGYYPFAYNSEKKVKVEIRKTEDSIITENVVGMEKNVEFEYFPEVPSEIRQKMFLELKPQFELEIENWASKLTADGYEINISNDFSIYNSDIKDSLTDSIVKSSISEKVVSLNNIFTSEREIIKPNPILGSFSMIDAMLKKSEPEYSYYNYINWNGNNIIGKSIYFESKEVTKVSFGITFLIYQAIYGIGLAKSSFYLDYNGYSNNNIKGPFTQIYAYKFNNNTILNINSKIIFDLEYFKEMIIKWNESRMKSINEFGDKAK
ncbi:caspase domain-containing protein [Flavobacterium sp.]|uniref:caspase family protein n=1 Tax=Flavobacterium sp. TaxID=239 RepID=UPI0038FBEE98